jgi:hypothetical protein
MTSVERQFTKPQVQTPQSIDQAIRSALSNHPICLEAFDIAVASMGERRVTAAANSAVKTEIAASILELAATGQLNRTTLAAYALRRVASFPLTRASRYL